ncbi:secreted antigen 1 [Babesia caballi]|uniref:Secreted antigen 1 n=1 Tax=Babesia caballi TaxID=5871 RepID=A0AAV4LLE3_BABCB|nr:secreted antigen 1 [Babesia caballi]
MHRRNNYGNYGTFDVESCAEECAIILLDISPDLYNTLFYLYFQVTPSFKRRGSGEWETQTCKKHFHSDNYLHEWLIGSQGISSSSSSNGTILSGGYRNEELSTKTGDDLHNILFSFVDGEGEETSFSKLIVTISLASDLTEASTAASVIWVVAFSKAVVRDTFVGKLTDPISTCISEACSNVLTNITLIAPEGSKGSNLIALCEGTVDYYTRNIKSDDFDACIEWLKDNLQEIIRNLQKMGAVCKDWDNNMLEYGKYAGPFPYGFMFGVAWKIGT